MVRASLAAFCATAAVILTGCSSKPLYKSLDVSVDQFVADFDRAVEGHHLDIKSIGEIKPGPDGMYHTRQSAGTDPSVDIAQGCSLNFSTKDDRITAVTVRVKTYLPDVPNRQCLSATILATDKTLTPADADKLISDLPTAAMATGNYDGNWNKEKIHAIVKNDYFYRFDRMDVGRVSVIDLSIMRSND